MCKFLYDIGTNIIGGIIGGILSVICLNKYYKAQQIKALYKGAIRDLHQWRTNMVGDAACPFFVKRIEALCDANILSNDHQDRFENAIANAMICSRDNRGTSLIGKMKSESDELIEILKQLSL